MSISLYFYPYSQHSRRVVSLLEEAKIEYQLISIDMAKEEYLSPSYTSVNPNQQVPTLIDGDIRIHESNAILRYLCLKYSLAKWYPENLSSRALVEQWLDWNQCRLSPAVIDIVLNAVFMGEMGDQKAIARGKENLPGLLNILNDGLSHRQFLAGDQMTIADLSVASNIFHLGFAKIEIEQVHIQNWYSKVSGLKGFIKSLPQ